MEAEMLKYKGQAAKFKDSLGRVKQDMDELQDKCEHQQAQMEEAHAAELAELPDYHRCAGFHSAVDTGLPLCGGELATLEGEGHGAWGAEVDPHPDPARGGGRAAADFAAGGASAAVAEMRAWGAAAGHFC